MFLSSLKNPPFEQRSAKAILLRLLLMATLLTLAITLYLWNLGFVSKILRDLNTIGPSSIDGIYQREHSKDGQTFRWTNGTAIVGLPNADAPATYLELAGGTPRTKSATIAFSSYLVRVPIYETRHKYYIALATSDSELVKLRIYSSPWKEFPGGRDIGIQISALALVSASAFPKALLLHAMLAVCLICGSLWYTTRHMGVALGLALVLAGVGAVWYRVAGWQHYSYGAALFALSVLNMAIVLSAWLARSVAQNAAHRDDRARGAVGVALIATSLLIGICFIYWRAFGDEGDTIAAGLLLAQGKLLYRDVFSHHFPFPYYWSATLIRLFGEELLVQRLAIPALFFANFALLARITKQYLLVGLTAISWAIIGHFYYGNSAIYETFTALALSSMFIITLTLALDLFPLTKSICVLIAIYIAVALLSDPLTCYPVLCCCGMLVVHRPTRRRAWQMGLIAGALLMGYGGYLLLSNTWGAFQHDTIWFNAHIYSRYTNTSTMRLPTLGGILSSGLGIFDTRWFNQNLLAPVAEYASMFDRRIDSGFFYRAAIIIASGQILLRGGWKAAIFCYIYAAALMMRSQEGLYIGALAIQACFLGFGTLLQMWDRRDHIGWASLAVRYLGYAIIAPLLALLLIRSGHFAIANYQSAFYESSYGRLESEAKRLRNLTCGMDASLLYYPSEPLLYVYSDMAPAARYSFLYPWVADIAMDEVKGALRTKPTVVYLSMSGEVWGNPNANYLEPLYAFLKKYYVQIDSETFVSPLIVKNCQNIQAGTMATPQPMIPKTSKR